MRSIMKQHGQDDVDVRGAYLRLLSGMSLTIGDNSGYRVKVDPKDDIEILKIEFNGEDITDNYIDGIVTLPEINSKSNLKVYRKGSFNGVEQINGISYQPVTDVYNMQGILVLKNATEAQINELAPGIYICNGRKISIR